MKGKHIYLHTAHKILAFLEDKHCYSGTHFNNFYLIVNNNKLLVTLKIVRVKKINAGLYF